MFIGAMSPESFGERLETFLREKLIVVVGDRQDIQETAIREGVRLVIVTGGLKVEKRLIEAALAPSHRGQRNGHQRRALRDDVPWPVEPRHAPRR